MIDRDDIEGLIESYFTHGKRLGAPTRAERLIALEGDRLNDWVLRWLGSPGQVPEVAWDVVVALVARAPDAEALAYVISGPLSDLATRHGDQFADRLVERARTDKGFRWAMGSVYRLDGVPPSLQARLGAVIETKNP